VLSDKLGVDIDPELLSVALTHRSFAYENGGIPHNERWSSSAIRSSVRP
jgi:ribonuclease-3